MAAQKNRLQVGLLLALLSTAYAHAGEVLKPTNAITLENHLAACINISHQSTFEEHGILFAKIQYKQTDSIASCGCKSAISAYLSYWQTKDDKAFLMKGNLLFGKGGTMNLPLAMDQVLVQKKAIRLLFSCAETQ